MGYMKIPNLEKSLDILNVCKAVYCMEKIHGSSAHISFKKGKLSFYAGGAKHTTFVAIFNEEALLEKFKAYEFDDVTVFGEVYGSNLQGMVKIYGPQLKFVAFDVKMGERWLNVPQAERVAHNLGLEFVFYNLVEATAEAVTAERDRPSTQAKRNGGGDNCWSEGVVIRPLIELSTSDGKRLMVKYKRPEYRETASVRQLDPEKQKLLENAEVIAEEFVTAMRLTHVLDKIKAAKHEAKPEEEYIFCIKDTGDVTRAMVRDIIAEHGDEFEWTAEIGKAIGRRSSLLFSRFVIGQQNS